MHEFWSLARLPADIVVGVFCSLLGLTRLVFCASTLGTFAACQHLRGLAIPPNLAVNLGQEVQFDSS